MTKVDHVKSVRALYEEAFKADPHRVEEVTTAVLGREVFSWDSLSSVQLHRLGACLMTTVLEARG